MNNCPVGLQGWTINEHESVHFNSQSDSVNTCTSSSKHREKKSVLDRDSTYACEIIAFSTTK